jgi:hypothetical protein
MSIWPGFIALNSLSICWSSGVIVLDVPEVEVDDVVAAKVVPLVSVLIAAVPLVPVLIVPVAPVVSVSDKVPDVSDAAVSVEPVLLT